MATVSILETERDYPTSDGKPMAETDLHRQVMVDLIEMLRDRYGDRSDVYVSGDLLMFYEPGKKRKHVAPDVFVVFGVENRVRPNYLVWNEGKGPDFIVEVTSKSTRAEDQKKKLLLYRDVLKVAEYFLFDPLGEYLRPSFQGHRLVAGEYVPIALEAGGLTSELLGIRMERDDRSLRLTDLATGVRLLTGAQRAEILARRNEFAEESRLAAEARAEFAEERAEFAEEARLAAEERAKVEADTRRAAEELAKAAQDLSRRLQAERDQALAELERLKGPKH